MGWTTLVEVMNTSRPVFLYDNEILVCMMMTDNHLGLFTNCVIMFCSVLCWVSIL